MLHKHTLITCLMFGLYTSFTNTAYSSNNGADNLPDNIRRVRLQVPPNIARQIVHDREESLRRREAPANFENLQRKYIFARDALSEQEKSIYLHWAHYIKTGEFPEER